MKMGDAATLDPIEWAFVVVFSKSLELRNDR